MKTVTINGVDMRDKEVSKAVKLMAILDNMSEKSGYNFEFHDVDISQNGNTIIIKGAK